MFVKVRVASTRLKCFRSWLTVQRSPASTTRQIAKLQRDQRLPDLSTVAGLSREESRPRLSRLLADGAVPEAPAACVDAGACHDALRGGAERQRDIPPPWMP